jgi:thiol-disulfide isomerase/thioredoxin
VFRLTSIGRRAGRGAAAAALMLGLAACEGGAIAQSTPRSNGTSFVAGGPGATVFAAAARKAAPDIAGITLAGTRLALSSYRGSEVVLNFWGSWCPPCRQEAPALAALSSRFRPGGVRFLGIDIRDNPASAQAFLRGFRIGYPSLNDPGDQLALDFRGTVPPLGIPTTLVIDRQGRIAARIVGGVSYDGLKTLITKIAAGPA